MNKAEEKKRLRAAGLFRLCREYTSDYRLAESTLFGVAIGVRYHGPCRRRKVSHEAANRLVAACETYAKGIAPRFGSKAT